MADFSALAIKKHVPHPVLKAEVERRVAIYHARAMAGQPLFTGMPPIGSVECAQERPRFLAQLLARLTEDQVADASGD